MLGDTAVGGACTGTHEKRQGAQKTLDGCTFHEGRAFGSGPCTGQRDGHTGSGTVHQPGVTVPFTGSPLWVCPPQALDMHLHPEGSGWCWAQRDTGPAGDLLSTTCSPWSGPGGGEHREGGATPCTPRLTRSWLGPPGISLTYSVNAR